MNADEQELARLDKQIEETIIEIAELKSLRIQERKAIRAAMPKKKCGRKPIDPDLLELAKKIAQRKPLSEVALQLNISLKTFYNKGISRAALDKEKLLNATDNHTENAPSDFIKAPKQR